MENITHLWNVVKFLTKYDEKKVNQLRNYYVQCCRRQGNTVELPKQCFGSSNMCSHCGSLWTKVEHKNRLISGKTCSNSIKKIIRTANIDGRLTRYRSTLMRKCLRNKMNKMIFKCFNCLKNTEITCNKPDRLTKKRQKILNDSNAQNIKKKKIRRSKDKMAGLNMSFSGSYISPSSASGSPEVCKQSSPFLCNGKKEIGKSMTPHEKLKKINKDKLGSMFKADSTKKRSSLNNFLKELY